VGRGYLNRPELTAERFLKDPFVDDPEARMYKTGDLGRWIANGDIEYLGRNDFQVKIRGFRIELGEIEARLMEYEGVSEAIVVARTDPPGDKRLAAYYIAGADVRPEALRAHLLASLPEYVVPAAYVRLDRMPLTHNGKLDRKALPAPDSRAHAVDAYEAPASPVEEKLARIWAGVLGLDRISRNANLSIGVRSGPPSAFKRDPLVLRFERLVILLADKAFDADERVIEPLLAAGKTPVIPPKSNRKTPRQFDKEIYKARHLIENFICRLKEFRAIATRYDKDRQKLSRRNSSGPVSSCSIEDRP
jgi:transposase